MSTRLRILANITDFKLHSQHCYVHHDEAIKFKMRNQNEKADDLDGKFLWKLLAAIETQKTTEALSNDEQESWRKSQKIIMTLKF